MPVPPKPADQRQRTNTPGVGLVTTDASTDIEVPAAPSGLLKAQREDWTTYWTSPLAKLTTEADIPALRRLFLYRDELERALKGFQKQRLVEGSQGQPRINPLGKQVTDLEGKIAALEDRFGLTPLSRLRLGVTLGQAAASLDDLNKSMAYEDDDDDDFDPRIIDVTYPASNDG